VPGEHAVGKQIKLTAQVNDFGKTVPGLNTQAGAVVKAIVVAPGDDVGDILSDAAVQPAPSPAGDNATAAQNKMTAVLAANPEALTRTSSEVILRDDGQAGSGDAKAGDGVYTALVPAEFEGHYNFVFVVQGQSESGGAFVRQQIRTVYVRSLPDPSKTTYVVTQVGQALQIVATPMNQNGGKLGPGWERYLWFVPEGGTPVKAIDNLDGTYTATVPFSGTTPPKVSVYFQSEPIYHPEGYVPAAGDLKPGDLVTADVRPDGGNGNGKDSWWKQWWFWVIVLIVLLLLWLLLRRK
jgi:hypothetical protein